VGVVASAGMGFEVPLCRKRHIGDWTRCTMCGLAEPARRDTPLLPGASSLEELMQVLPEHSQEQYEHRLDIEERIANGESVPAEFREVLLEEPFRAVSHRLNTTIWLRVNTVVAVLSIFIGVIAPALLWTSVTSAPLPRWCVFILWLPPTVLCAAGFSAVRYVVERSRKKEFALARRALSPLRPSEAELIGTIKRLRRAGIEVCRRLRPRRLAHLVASGN
jgi:hypothetical protein